MIESFRKERNTHWIHNDVEHLKEYELVVIDLENGEFEQINYSVIEHEGIKYRLTLTPHRTNTEAMGYKQPKDYLKRAKELNYEKFDLLNLEQYPEWDAELLYNKAI